MSNQDFDDLLRDVPGRVHLSPADAWAEAGRRRRRRRTVASTLAGVGIAAVVVAAVALTRSTGQGSVEPASSPGATFVRAEHDGEIWRVLRSDGTVVTLEPKVGSAHVPLGISPDGRWLSYVQGPESGSVVNLYLLRSNEDEPRAVTQAESPTVGFAHHWAPSSNLVLVPLVDGDSNLIDTDLNMDGHQAPVGETVGFVDDDSLGWVAQSRGLTWTVTDLQMNPEKTLPLDIGYATLNPSGRPQLMSRQASLSPDGTRVAILLADYRDQAKLYVFSTIDGSLLESEDTTAASSDLVCPLHWVKGSASLTPRGQTCIVSPGAS